MLHGVLFICLGNSCRSIMAEALTRHLLGDSVTAASAGLQPLGYVALETLQVLAEIGAPCAGLHSKGLAEINLAHLGLVINLTAYSLDSLLPSAWRGRIIHRPVSDPFGGGLEDYRRSREEIHRLLTSELPRYLAGR